MTIKKVEFYLEDFHIDQDELEEAIREEMQVMGIDFTKIYPKLIVEYCENEKKN